jgi:hypothetical protein
MKPLFTLFLAVTIFSNAFSQQAWTKPKGKYFSQVAFSYLNYNGLLDSNENVKLLNRDIFNNNLQAYFEYGITDKFMVTAIVPIVFASSKVMTGAAVDGPVSGSLAGFSNIELAGTFNFYQKNGLVVSTKLNASLPTASASSATGLRTGVDALSIEPSLLVGLGRTTYFTSAELGYAFRTNKHSSRTLASFQIGKFFGKHKKLIGIFNVNLILSNKDGTYDDGTSIYTAVYLNDLSYLAPGIKLGYKVNPKIMIWGNIRGALPPSQQIGSNEALTPGFTLSVSYSN